MAHPVEHKRGGHIVARLLAVALSAILITCLIIPIQQARVNTQQEFRDAYVYRAQAKRYYLAIHAAHVSFDTLCETLLSQSPGAAGQSAAAFSFFSRKKATLDAQDALMRSVRAELFDLQSLRDPGNGDIVDAVSEYYNACLALYAKLRSGQYDAGEYRKELFTLQKEAHGKQARLRTLMNDR